MRKYSSRVGFLGTALALVAISGSTVVALQPQANVHAQDATSSVLTGQPKDPGSQAGTKLADARLRACQNRQNAINNILSRIVKRGTNQLNLFNTIAQRVETFKTNKNLDVTNYDQLLATLQADQSKATSDLAAMKANDTLDCTGSNPKGMVEAFKTDLKTEISDLQTYKTDVKNLIVAVKTAAGSSASSNSSSSTDNTDNTGGNQ